MTMQATIATAALKHAATMGRETAHRNAGWLNGANGYVILEAKAGGLSFADGKPVYSAESSVTMTGSDLDSDCYVTMPAQTVASGTITVLADPFYKAIMAAAKGKAPSVALANGGDTITVGNVILPCTWQPKPDPKTGKIPQVVKASPLAEREAAAVKFAMAGSELFDMLASVAPAMSCEETRYYLNGMHFSAARYGGGDPARLCAVATDGHRLAKYDSTVTVDWPEQWDDPEHENYDGRVSVIVRRKTVDLILRTLKACKMAERCTVEFTAKRVTVTIGQTVIAGKLIDGTFPDYERVIPVRSVEPVAAGFDWQALGEAIKASGAGSGRGVTLVLDREGCELRDGDTVHKLAGIDWPGERTGFNPRFVRDIAGTFGDLGAAVTISQADTGSPARIDSPRKRGLTWVLMPLRV